MVSLSISPPNEDVKNNSTVDTSRAFNSVKEAVAIFGEKLMSGELYSSPRPFFSPKQEMSPLRFLPKVVDITSSSSPSKQGTSKSLPSPMKSKGKQSLVDTLQRLESELEETKMELKLLKERESETEAALASLNAELHKNMSKIAQSEARAAATARTNTLRNGERKRDLAKEFDENSPTLAQILGFGERKVMKKQPVAPIITHLFSRKKVGANSSLDSSLFASHVYLN